MKKSLILLFVLISACQQRASTRFVSPSNGYAQMVVVEQSGVKTLHISGQVGKGIALEEQMRDVLVKLNALLQSEGGDFQDLVKINTYIVDYEPADLDTFREVRKEVFSDEITPASTLVGVSALGLPEWLIEIDAVAVIQ
ncbi:MAG: 2-iminobutanoate/2-iminopropanoate deaminase [Cyclobacteriaceae bacterium]|jgi:2-iminobutanoate/2-iminopropanoate deaminase